MSQRAASADAVSSEVVYTRGALGTGERVYHTDRECPYLERAHNVVEVRRGRLREEARECDRCNHGNVSGPRGEGTECPLCGEAVKKLPHHLRNECDGT